MFIFLICHIKITDPLPLIEYAIDCYNAKSSECFTENGLRSKKLKKIFKFSKIFFALYSR